MRNRCTSDWPHVKCKASAAASGSTAHCRRSSKSSPAMSKICKLDEQLFMGAATKIHEFLDIEPLMPPGRLRLSKLLGRPVMEDLICNCAAVANIEELRRLDCVVYGGMVEWVDGFPESWDWTGPVIDPPDLVGCPRHQRRGQGLGTGMVPGGRR